MTRGNLNFVSHGSILFHYHNGDQYPEGLVDYFGVRDFCGIDRLWTPDDFRDWIRNNYTEACRRITTAPNGMTIDAHAQSDIPAEPEAIEQPCIYYTGSFITDYSYVFTHSFKPGRKRKDGSRSYRTVNYVYAYNWAKLIFEGTPKDFLRWVEKKRDPEPHLMPPDQSVKASVERAITAAVAPADPCPCGKHPKLPGEPFCNACIADIPF